MRRVKKGHYGYFSYRRNVQFLKAACVLLGIIGLLVIGWITTKSRRNGMTIAAIVSVLPFANVLVVGIALLPFHSRPEAEEAAIRGMIGEGVYSTELALTRKNERTIRLDYLYVHPKGVFCFTGDAALDESDAQQYIRKVLRESGFSHKVQVTKNLQTFQRWVTKLEPVSRKDCEEDLLRIEGILYAISL